VGDGQKKQPAGDVEQVDSSVISEQNWVWIILSQILSLSPSRWLPAHETHVWRHSFDDWQKEQPAARHTFSPEMSEHRSWVGSPSQIPSAFESSVCGHVEQSGRQAPVTSQKEQIEDVQAASSPEKSAHDWVLSPMSGHSGNFFVIEPSDSSAKQRFPPLGVPVVKVANFEFGFTRQRDSIVLIEH
jgi:hypothetical protein